jgi:hypothetical protein
MPVAVCTTSSRHGKKEMAVGGFVFVLFLTIEYNEMGIIPKSKYSNSPI